MTAKRWEIVGGLAMGLVCIVSVNAIQPNPLSLTGITIAIVASMIGNGIGRWTVREWQKAGHGGR